MALTEAQLRQRDGKVSASFVNALMAADEKRILNEWRLLVGDPAYVQEDFSDDWLIQFGNLLEPFALNWHQRKTGYPLTRRGEVVAHPRLPHVCCTLDAWREHDNCVVDCKGRNGFQRVEDILAKYTPQLVIQKACLEADRASLLVVHGGTEPREFPITWPADYEEQVWERVAWFWECVQDLVAPVCVEPIRAPAPVIRTYDMSKSNQWAVQAAAWLQHGPSAKAFGDAEKAIKELVPRDAKSAFGHGISVTRDARNRMSIKPSKEKAANGR